MTLMDLKKMLTGEQKAVPEELIIFYVHVDAAEVNKKSLSSEEKARILLGKHFLVNSYIEEICKVKNCNTIPVESIYEPQVSALAMVLDYDSNIALLKTDKFTEQPDPNLSFTNTIVVCEEIDKDIKESLADYIIEIPVLQDWHVKELIKQRCPALDDYDAEWLYNATEGNIYRVLQELDKILLFSQKQQKEIFTDIKFDPCSDLHIQTIFDISNALVKGNKLPLLEYLCFGKHADFDPIAIVNNTLREVKNTLYAIYGNLSAEQIGIKDNQLRGIKYGNKNLSAQRAQKMITFLSQIDLRLKSSELDMSRERLIDYIICHILAI